MEYASMYRKDEDMNRRVKEQNENNREKLNRTKKKAKAASTKYKADTGKLRAGLFLRDFAHALTEVVKSTNYGVEKYQKPGSWVDVPEAEDRYFDALTRHLLEEAKDEDSRDEESGLRHLAAMVWNALAVLELRLRDYDWEEEHKPSPETHRVPPIGSIRPEYAKWGENGYQGGPPAGYKVVTIKPAPPLTPYDGEHALGIKHLWGKA